ncbi:hypothetical protein HaLaN_09682 [Haematococcus lacustris]|uniref:Uncharacterized protein n=1 Tax=Haematococcus lacustris TaxID=44745 RepID=A0A699YVJ0_HAELA|nr:hypothetical protein HaLaN_09682 [Haematococcus lacustris]
MGSRHMQSLDALSPSGQLPCLQPPAAAAEAAKAEEAGCLGQPEPGCHEQQGPAATGLARRLPTSTTSDQGPGEEGQGGQRGPGGGAGHVMSWRYQDAADREQWQPLAPGASRPSLLQPWGYQACLLDNSLAMQIAAQQPLPVQSEAQAGTQLGRMGVTAADKNAASGTRDSAPSDHDSVPGAQQCATRATQPNTKARGTSSPGGCPAGSARTSQATASVLADNLSPLLAGELSKLRSACAPEFVGQRAAAPAGRAAHADAAGRYQPAAPLLTLVSDIAESRKMVMLLLRGAEQQLRPRQLKALRQRQQQQHKRSSSKLE